MSLTTQATPVGQNTPEIKVIEGRSPRQLAMARLRKDRPTLIAAGVALFLVLVAIAAPILVAAGVINTNGTDQTLLNSALGGIPKGSFGGISGSHWLGVVPGTGVDLMGRLAFGLTVSMIISIGATIISILVGAIIGMLSGFLGGKTDFFLGRFIDLVLCFPQTLMLLALSNQFVQKLQDLGVPAGDMANGLYVMLVLGLFGWPSFARLIRGQVLTLRNREFVEAARSLGSSRGRIYVKELLPNLWAPILIIATLMMPTYVSAEAALSYLGVGIKPPTPTMGNILTDSVTYAQSDATYFLLPAIVIAAVVLSFNLVGDGLRDALDPKSNR